MNHEPQLELTLLGWPNVRVIGADGVSTEVALPTKKALALLAYLALNGSTPRAELASLLWGDNTDAEAKKNLRQDVYRLLMTEVGEFLEVSRQSLGLRGAVTVDVRRMRDAASIGDLERVTGLYRGPLLESVHLPSAMDFEDWLEVEREALSRLQREALIARARDQERRGDLRSAIESVEQQLHFDPLQEVPQRELMRLHWLLGERAEALGRFAKLSAVLDTELGLEPSAETLALERQIRASEEAPRFQGVLPFVGRAEAWSWLEETKGLALLIGEPGVGKTRLLREFASRQKSATSSLHLRGFETAQSTAFYPVTAALLEHFERHPESFDALRPAWRLEIERLLPGHDGRTRESPSAEGRGWFLEAITQTLLALAEAHGQILLDDLHWFDAASCELLTQLARRGGHLRLIATAGRDEYANSPAARALEPLIRDGFASTMTLKPLSMGDLVALLHRLGGQHASELIHCAATIFETTGGNPLFFHETLREALDLGVLHVTQEGWVAIQTHGHHIAVTSSVREAITRRIARLGAPVKRLLEAASLVADSFSLEVVSAAADLGAWEGVETLETALSAQLIEPAMRGYRFAQNVTRRALADGLGTQRRALLHLGLAHALADAPGNAAQVALHLERAGRPQEAVPYRVRAAQDAANAYAYTPALESYDAALEDGADPETVFNIRAAKLKLFEALGDNAGWASELELLERLSARSDAPVMLARVALARAEFEFHHGHYERAHEVLSALKSHDALPQDLRAGLLYRDGMALVRLGRLEAADALLQRALSETREDDAPRGAIHHALSISAFHGGQIALAHEHNRAAITRFRAQGDPSGQAMALSFAGRLATTQGNPDAALEAIQEALQLARELHFVPLLRSTLLNASAALLQVGDHEAAAVYLEEGSKLTQDTSDPRIQGLYLTHGSAVLRMRGDLAGTLAAYREALVLFDAAQAMHPATFERLNLIDLLLDCGQILEARDALTEVARLITAHGFSDLQVWLEALRVKWALIADQPLRIATLQIALREPQRLRVDIRHEALLALAAGQLRLGDARTAIETLSVLLESPESPPENRARASAILLRAHGQHGSISALLQRDVNALLEDQRVSPLAKLDLHHALAENSDGTAIIEPRRALRESAQRLSLSLPINQRGAFIARWTKVSASKRLEAAD